MPRSNLKLYVVYDVIAEIVSGPVMPAINDLSAQRAFAQAVLDPQSLGKNPEDYRLLRIGEIGDFGDVTPEDPTVVVTGAEVVATFKERRTEA